MNISFEGFNEQTITFEAAQGTQKGDLVCMEGNGKVSKALNGENIIGVVNTIRDGYAGVQISGFAKVAYTGNISAGYNTLLCGGGNALRIAVTSGANADTSTGRQYLVVEADTLTQTAGVILA